MSGMELDCVLELAARQDMLLQSGKRNGRLIRATAGATAPKGAPDATADVPGNTISKHATGNRISKQQYQEQATAAAVMGCPA